MRFPSIKDVAHDLKIGQLGLRHMMRPEELEDGCTEVRLQVLPSGNWGLATGDSSYDTDHRGFWGASFLPYGRCNLRDLARDLIEQARDSYARSEEED